LGSIFHGARRLIIIIGITNYYYGVAAWSLSFLRAKAPVVKTLSICVCCAVCLHTERNSAAAAAAAA